MTNNNCRIRNSIINVTDDKESITESELRSSKWQFSINFPSIDSISGKAKKENEKVCLRTPNLDEHFDEKSFKKINVISMHF